MVKMAGKGGGGVDGKSVWRVSPSRHAGGIIGSLLETFDAFEKIECKVSLTMSFSERKSNSSRMLWAVASTHRTEREMQAESGGTRLLIRPLQPLKCSCSIETQNFFLLVTEIPAWEL